MRGSLKIAVEVQLRPMNFMPSLRADCQTTPREGMMDTEKEEMAST